MYTIIDKINFNSKKIINNKMAKVIVCYLFSFAFVKGTSFLMIPLYANFLEKSDYGHFTFLITLLSLFSLLTDLGLNNGLYRYIKQKKRDSLILCSVLSMSFIVNVLTYLLVFLSIDVLHLLPYEVHFDHLSILFASLILSSFTMLNLTYFRIYNKAGKYLICSIAQPLIHLSCFSFLIFIDIVNIENLLYSTLISNMITTTVTIVLNRKSFLFVFRVNMMKKLIKYTIGTTVSILALYVLTGLDKFFLAYYISPENLADYSLVILFSSITILLMEPISLWYFANRFKMIKEKIKFEKVTSYLIILNIWVGSMVAINGSFLFDLLLPENYNLDISVFFLAVISFHFKYLSTIMNIGCYIDKDTNRVAKINITVAILVFLTFNFMATNYNTLGIVLAVMIGYLMILVANIYYSQKRVIINYKKNEIIPNYIGSFILIFLIFDFNLNMLFSNLLMASFAISINIKGLKYVKNNEIKARSERIKEISL